MHRADGALQKAGRIVLHAVWADPSLLAHALSMVPLDGIPDELQRTIFSYLNETEEWDGTQLASKLGDEAAEELSRAIVENEDDAEDAAETSGDALAAYSDSIALLRRAYLKQRYEQLSREATEASTSGDVAGMAEKLKELTEIKKEMDG